MLRKFIAPFGALACGLALAVTGAQAQDPYFKGKTITLLVGYDSGQTDLTARTLARHLENVEAAQDRT